MPFPFITAVKERSLIERLSSAPGLGGLPSKQDEFLRKLSANARGPGGQAPKSASGWTVGRPALPWLKHATNLGVVPITVRPTAALVVSVWAAPPLAYRANMIVDAAPDATPASLTFTNDNEASITFGAAGAKTIDVQAALAGTAPARSYAGKAVITL